MLDILIATIVFLVMLSVLVAAHELGHYLFARLFNMGVEEFAIGFGKKPLWTWMKRTYTMPLEPGMIPVQTPEEEKEAVKEASGGQKLAYALEGGVSQHGRPEIIDTENGQILKETTVFTIRPWPIGGFVRIKGMLPENDGSETRIAGGFYSKAPWKRILVLLAGPAFSVLAGILIMIPVFTIWGAPRALPDPVFGGVSEDTPAHVAGLKPGDRVLAINDRPVETFYDMTSIVRAAEGQKLNFRVERQGAEKTITVIPQKETADSMVLDDKFEPTGDFEKQVKIGVSPLEGKVRLPFNEAVSESLLVPGKAVTGLINLFAKPKNFSKSVGGPATMFTATKYAAQDGVDRVLYLAAIISISVGIFNLLPAPPLDGGQIVIAFAEMLRGGRRLSIKIQEKVAIAGFAAVMTLIVAVLFVDVIRFAMPNTDHPLKANTKVEQPQPEKAE
jgi:regulator of sigma E protease